MQSEGDLSFGESAFYALKQRVTELEAENTKIKTENAEVKAKNATLKQIIEENVKLKAEVAKLKKDIKEIKPDRTVPVSQSSEESVKQNIKLKADDSPEQLSISSSINKDQTSLEKLPDSSVKNE